jgi:large subunit ribosomal protein L15
MLLQNNLQSIPGSRHRIKRVGRGNGSNRGTYSGLGNKGQHSRGSAKIHRTFTGQGGRSRFILGIPKNRGFKPMTAKAATITINFLNRKFDDGQLVDAKSLFDRGVLSSISQDFKIVGNSKLTKKLTFAENIRFSKSVKESIK